MAFYRFINHQTEIYLKTLLKQFIPPILWNFLSFLRSNTITNQRIYKTYAEASFACQEKGYEFSDIVKVVVEKNLIFRNTNHSNPVFDIGTLRTLIGLGLANKSNNLKFNVLDFGGGGGYHYTIASAALGKTGGTLEPDLAAS